MAQWTLTPAYGRKYASRDAMMHDLITKNLDFEGMRDGVFVRNVNLTLIEGMDDDYVISCGNGRGRYTQLNANTVRHLRENPATPPPLNKQYRPECPKCGEILTKYGDDLFCVNCNEGVS